MCLILFAWQAHPKYALVVAANRDEFHQRPTGAAGFWDDEPGLLAGRDLQAGGTWLGVTRTGRFAAITNYREPLTPARPLERSRGALVRDFLAADTDPDTHAHGLAAGAGEFRGFNLLLGTTDRLAYFSNRNGPPLAVTTGVHGLSNHLLDTDWPKVHSGRARLADMLGERHIQAGDLFGLLTDRSVTPGEFPENLDDSLVGEQLASHYFIVSPVYGTRSSTVLLAGHDGSVEFAERQFDASGNETATHHFEFTTT